MSLYDELIQEVDKYFKPNIQYNKQVEKELNPKVGNIEAEKKIIEKCKEYYENALQIVSAIYEVVSKKRKSKAEIRIQKQKKKEEKRKIEKEYKNAKEENIKKIIKNRRSSLIELVKDKNFKDFIDRNFNLQESSKDIRKKAEQIIQNYLSELEKIRSKSIYKLSAKKLDKKIQEITDKYAEKIGKLQIQGNKFVKEMLESVDKHYQKKLSQFGGGSAMCPSINDIKTKLVKNLVNILNEYIFPLDEEIEAYEITINKTMAIDPDELSENMFTNVKHMSQKLHQMYQEREELIKMKILIKEEFDKFDETLDLLFGGGWRKYKKIRIRKHKGINQQTGRLKKGYKYTGKKLKSGIPQIIKVHKN